MIFPYSGNKTRSAYQVLVKLQLSLVLVGLCLYERPDVDRNGAGDCLEILKIEITFY